MALPSGPGRLSASFAALCHRIASFAALRRLGAGFAALRHWGAGFAALCRLAVPRVLPTMLRRHAGQALTLLLAFALAAALMLRFVGNADAKPRYDIPHDGQIEAALGIRFSQAAVVADGGLVELRYVVLDTQKASAFQNDTKHPPLLRDERNNKTAWRAALMKQGHELRPGQSYYLLYLNNQGAIKRGDKIAIEAGPRRLVHVPVR